MMTTSSCHRRANGGFTLYEVVVVLIVFLVVSAVLVPSFTGFLPSVRVRKAGSGLLATLGKARFDAALTARRLRVIFAKGELPSYRIVYEPDPMNEPATFRALPGEWGTKTELPEGVSFESIEGSETDPQTSEEFLEFSADGSAPAATIVLAHENGEKVTLEVDPADGRTRVVEPEEKKP
ncbi:MAG TPA: prepilin-type N-terminal cleavage/methylation domain-containing protein [Planctomycetota bacterium]|nr:prepilin-type N-terminal cleavage/methylation domain-containing protein [Planctomycetota bacterium]